MQARPGLPQARHAAWPRRSRCSPAPPGRSSTAGSSRSSSRRRWPPTRSSARSPRPSMPGTAYVLFHHVMGETNGKRGVWGYVRAAWAASRRRWPRAAQAHGRRDPHRTPRSRRILVEDGRVDRRGAGRRRRVRARRSWPATPTAHVTFSKLLEPQASCRPTSSPRSTRIGYESASLKINVALARAAELHGLPGHERRPAAPRHDPHLPRPGLHRARLRRRQVRPAVARPGARMHDPVGGRSDASAPPGKHLMSMFVQYAPYKLARRHAGTRSRTRFADRCFDMLDEYAPELQAAR